MIKFCIDAGHGGKDSGAVNGGCYEKAVTLAVARKLRERLLAKRRSLSFLATASVTAFS